MRCAKRSKKNMRKWRAILEKDKTLKEWARVLKPGGRLFMGDIVIEKKMSQAALDDISLWTG